MIIAELPDDEEMRLLDLASYDIVSKEAEEDFSELAETAAQVFKCPIALVTLIDKTQQWFKGISGTKTTGNTRDLSFCSHTILQNEVLVVKDATKDKRFFDNPVVAGDHNIRFYAGAAIISIGGHKLGTVCLYDVIPREFSMADNRLLTLFAKQASRLFELRKKNIIIRQRAQEIISLKTDLIGNEMQRQEDEKKMIADNLHEDLAQRIASIIIYINTSLNRNGLQCEHLQTAKIQLQQLLKKTKQLSYTIVPPSIHLLPVENLIADFIEKIKPAFDFTINLNISGKAPAKNNHMALTIIRILERWLKVLAQKKGVSTVNISLSLKKKLELVIEDNALENDNIKRENEVFESQVYDRVKSRKGSVDLSVSPAGKHLLILRLPFPLENNTYD